MGLCDSNDMVVFVSLFLARFFLSARSRCECSKSGTEQVEERTSGASNLLLLVEQVERSSLYLRLIFLVLVVQNVGSI